MDAQSERNPMPERANRRALVTRRLEIEAKLLAHWSGWLALDDIQLKKLDRELRKSLELQDDALVRALIGRRAGPAARA